MFIKSPINYTGNKYRILKEVRNYIPKCKVFVDLFTGGATVGFNVDAEKIFMIDNNQQVIGLLEYIASTDIIKMIRNIERLITQYNLTYSAKYSYGYYKEIGLVDGNNGLKPANEKGFYKLREDYNQLVNKRTNKANTMLYTLMVYAFNNDIRFNKKGEFNLPCGKTDFNSNNKDKLLKFNQRAKEINYEFICADFMSEEVSSKLKIADFVYADPPYLITNAFYNENGGWSEENEYKLISLLKSLNDMGKGFLLSNVLMKKGKTNHILKSFIESNDFVKSYNVDYHYRSASYNKKDRNAKEQEILVTNRWE